MTNIFARQALERGVLAHKAGKLTEAEQAYKSVLASAPDHAEALYLLAVVYIKQGRMAEGEKFAARAIAKDPGQPAPHFHRGVALAGMRRLPEAVASFDRAIALKPDYAEAFNNRGVALGMLGRGQEAVASFDRAIALRPAHLDAFVNRGIALLGLGRAQDAIASFDSALVLRPDLTEILLMRGKVRLSLKQAAPALADFDHILATQPSHAEAQLGRAHALLICDRAAEALAPAERATALGPALAETWFTRANVLLALGRHEKAIPDYDRALALKPDWADALVNRGNAHFALRRLASALADYGQAITLQPNPADALVNRATALVAAGRTAEALADCDRVIALKPDSAQAWSDHGNLLSSLGRHDDALASYRQAKSLDAGLDYVQGAMLRAKMHVCDWREFERDCAQLLANVDGGEIVEAPHALLFVASSAAQQRRCAQHYAAAKFPPREPALWRGENYRHQKIRLAYLSGALRDHPTIFLMGGLFESHDRARFETMALSFGPDDGGAARKRLQVGLGQFIDVSGKGDQEIAELIREREVDILVDLDGYIDAARTGIMARRAAPVQVNCLGYPGTMGAPYIDYIIADRILIAAGEADDYSEKIVRLPDSYQPNFRSDPAGAPPTRRSCGLPDDGLVFCSFNNINKLTPDVFAIWMRLLQKIDGSILWLLAASDAARANLRRAAQAQGVDPARLLFADFAGREDHLARQQLADLFLDTHYCNAHTTASDALWAGLPLLTCRGQAFAGRVAASLLQAAGLPELVTENLDAYEALALRLAREPALLQSYRDRLARSRATCALFDSGRFRQGLEAAYLRMWETAQRGEPAQSFDVPSPA